MVKPSDYAKTHAWFWYRATILAHPALSVTLGTTGVVFGLCYAPCCCNPQLIGSRLMVEWFRVCSVAITSPWIALVFMGLIRTKCMVETFMKFLPLCCQADYVDRTETGEDHSEHIGVPVHKVRRHL